LTGKSPVFDHFRKSLFYSGSQKLGNKNTVLGQKRTVRFFSKWRFYKTFSRSNPSKVPCFDHLNGTFRMSKRRLHYNKTALSEIEGAVFRKTSNFFCFSNAISSQNKVLKFFLI
jgi:hypothetical protein